MDPDVWTSALATAKSEILASVERRKRLVAGLVAGISDGIMVLQARDGMSIHRDQATERARNVVAWMILHYKIEEMIP